MIKNAIKRAIIVGSGITGSISASLIKSDSLQVSILDKGRGAGKNVVCDVFVSLVFLVRHIFRRFAYCIKV